MIGKVGYWEPCPEGDKRINIRWTKLTKGPLIWPRAGLFVLLESSVKPFNAI
jgi:hypothetical protein